MSFYENLQNSSNNSSIWGQRKREPDPDIMGMDAEFRNRDFNDYVKKQKFDQQMSQRQPAMQNIFNPNGAPIGSNGQPMGVVFKDNHPDKPQTTAEDDISKDVLDEARVGQINRSGKLDQAKFGLEEKKFGLAKEGHELDKLKNQQIFDTKHADLQRKTDEANSRLDLAERTLQSKQGDSMALAERHKADAAAKQAQFDLVNYQKDLRLQQLQEQLDSNSAATRERLRQSSGSQTKTALDKSGQEKTVGVTKGAKRVGVTHPDGTHGTIDASDADSLPEGWKLD